MLDSEGVGPSLLHQEPIEQQQEGTLTHGQVTPVTPQVSIQLLSTLLLFKAKKQLNFNPLPPPPRKNKMQQPGQQVPPLNPKVRAAQFRGKPKEDPDCHVAQFNTKWVASGYDALYGDAVKRQQFAATLEGAAMSWYSQFGVGHFPTFVSLRDAFLGRFRKDKTTRDIIKRIEKMKQKGMLVEDYAQKFRSLVDRIEQADRPAMETLAGYFLKGLRKDLKTAVANVNVAAGLNDLIQAANCSREKIGIPWEEETQGRAQF